MAIPLQMDFFLNSWSLQEGVLKGSGPKTHTKE
jgi:hypothetical protein